MHRLFETRPTIEEDLALDEALLEQAEASETPREILRIWEPARAAVIIGCSSQIALEVDEPACQTRGLPVLRRISGGAAIVAGPGCLMYSLVLSYQRRPSFRNLDEAHRFVMERILSGLHAIAPNALREDACDLTLEGRKFSGNSVRCKREHLLYHGTLLYDFALDSIGHYLRMPPRQPEYRQGRSHDRFVVNLPATAETLSAALCQAWDAFEPATDVPYDRMQTLVAEKYSQPAWNRRR